MHCGHLAQTALKVGAAPPALTGRQTLGDSVQVQRGLGCELSLASKGPEGTKLISPRIRCSEGGAFPVRLAKSPFFGNYGLSTSTFGN